MERSVNMKKRKNIKTKLLALFFVFMLIGLGYAYLTANLKITGTANIGNARWDIHFNNPGFAEASTNTSFPSNSNSNSNSNLTQGVPLLKGTNNTELEYNVSFTQPGDYYNFTVDVVNSGDIDAKYIEEGCSLKIKIGDAEEISLENCTQDENWPSYLDYSYEAYNSGDNYKKITAGNTVKLLVHIGINADITNEAWNSIRGKSIVVKDAIRYRQAD